MTKSETVLQKACLATASTEYCSSAFYKAWKLHKLYSSSSDLCSSFL